MINSLNDTTEDDISESQYDTHLDEVRGLFKECRGNAVRIQEELLARFDIEIPYQSLTWLLRKWEIRTPRKKRAGVYVFKPGIEMQHDTSPHRFKIGKKLVTAQCASLVLGYSRKLFIQYYPCFTRFECKVFLAKAIKYMGGACDRCIIDNTSVIVANGVGPNAEMAPPMSSFGNMYGFHFSAHVLMDPNRKGKVERPFAYVEGNFLVGRVFNDWEDLNKQALDWCENIANKKKKKSLGMSPHDAYVAEKPHLNPMPLVPPPVYVSFPRMVDIEGYVTLDTNRYSVPEKYIGEHVDVLKYWEQVVIYLKQRIIAKHRRCIDGREKRVTNQSHHQPHFRKIALTGPSIEEKTLLGTNEILDKYVIELKKQSRGRGTIKLRRLLGFKRTYPPIAFYKAIEKALHYGLYDLTRLETMIIKNVSGNYFELT